MIFIGFNWITPVQYSCAKHRLTHTQKTQSHHKEQSERGLSLALENSELSPATNAVRFVCVHLPGRRLNAAVLQKYGEGEAGWRDKYGSRVRSSHLPLEECLIYGRPLCCGGFCLQSSGARTATGATPNHFRDGKHIWQNVQWCIEMRSFALFFFSTSEPLTPPLLICFIRPSDEGLRRTNVEMWCRWLYLPTIISSKSTVCNKPLHRKGYHQV